MKTFGQRADRSGGLRLERMRASPLWQEGERGGGFRNIHPMLPGLRDTRGPRPSLGDFLCGGDRRAPSQHLPSVNPLPLWQQPADTGLRATWLGHSTVLVEIDGYTVLTDPVWGPRASPLRFAGPKRFQPMPIKLKQLPVPDVVVISHDHYDHLDYPTVVALARHTRVPIITSLGVGAHLEAWGVPAERIHELDWWQSFTLPGGELQVTAAPSQHFSGRGLKDRNATLWSSMVIRSAKHRVFFSGDTGLTTEYDVIRDRLGPFDLIMLEVGAFHPSWGDIHLGPANALKAWQLLGGGPFLPIHWGTFALALHPWDEPAEALLAQAPALQVPLVMPRLGEPVEPSRVEGVTSWWRAVDEGAAAPTASTPTLKLPRELPWPMD
ncbi:MAG TPA: MBL fold metallo-hydrolase [Ideonella sp.]|uniref:MBL fold metallo-hydrolase n=1 Tax=Ideonella sp. TaxID=1929293 RepID=UPI002E3585F2|nr:MBL fold metallo-hydrolase [Ideonella sp.]HEX5686970.1 MBL fold metallo-hydrolase [Ideonella sp.]